MRYANPRWVAGIGVVLLGFSFLPSAEGWMFA